jgi:hypothetical protein
LSPGLQVFDYQVAADCVDHVHTVRVNFDAIQDFSLIDKSALHEHHMKL